jgi:2-oxoisovalerate dehydrogenase E2 component (dihydrolipoyl transacylase)
MVGARMTMLKDFALPDLGEGLTESELVSWRVAVGDTVELNQIIAEVETAKALVELPSPFAGVINKFYAEPGAIVMVGAPIVAFELPDAAVAEDAQRVSAERTSAERAPVEQEPMERESAQQEPVEQESVEREPAGREPVLVGYGPPVEGAERPKRRPRPGLERIAADEPLEPAVAHDSADRSERETRIPIHGVRKHTAFAMVASAFTAPHVTEFLTIDVTSTMDLIAGLKGTRAFTDVRLNLLTVVSKALCVAVARTPSVNSRWDDANQVIIQYNYVNLGIAAATPRGLVVPNIKDADRMDLSELARALGDLVETARAGKSSPADLGGGTISITNIGVFGIDAGTPILNPGEAVILAMGAVRRMPWEFRDEIALRQVMTLSASFDHRLVDGEQASRFLSDVGAILSDPAILLTMV